MQSAERVYEPEEYLALERAAEFKSELIDGYIVGMAGATVVHSLIAANALWRLAAQLDSRPCQVHGSDVRVKAGARRSYFYPDVSVVCGEMQFADEHGDTLQNPTVVIEVLSPSTAEFDRGLKWGEYQLLPSLQHYVLIAQDRISVEVFTRHRDLWLYACHRDLDAIVQLPAIGCQLAVSQIYQKVVFPPAKTEAG